jgi:nuclear pore complex protein Nup98-Nup96
VFCPRTTFLSSTDMTRFRAFDSDSEDDDVSIQDEQPSKLSVDDTPFVEDDEEEEEDEESLEEESSEEDGSEDEDVIDEDEEEDETSSQTSEMQEDELVLTRKPASKNALMQDEAGAFRHAHELSPPPANSSVLRRNMDFDPQRMQVMQSSLFRMPEESAAMRAMDSQANARKGAFLNRKHSRDSDGESMRQDWRGVRLLG